MSTWAALTVACSSKQEGPLPALQGATPQLVCTEQLTTTVTLSGERLAPAPHDALTESQLVLPQITLVQERDLAGAAVDSLRVSIPDHPEAGHVTWVNEAQMTFDVYPELNLAPGLWGIETKNPAGDVAYAPASLVGVAAPTLHRVEADLVCAAQEDRRVVLYGTGFVVAGEDTPSVALGESRLSPDSWHGCTRVEGPVQELSVCTELAVSIPAGTAAGTYPITVTNPAPAACASTEAVDLFLMSPPVLESVEPRELCTAQGETLVTVTGSGFLLIDDATPQLILNDGSDDIYVIEDVSADDMTGCTSFDGPAEVVSACTSFSAVLPGDEAANVMRALDARVQNPLPAGCNSELLQVAQYPPPTLSDVTPTSLCLGGGRLSVTGTDLYDGAVVQLFPSGGGNPVLADTVTANGTGTELQADFSMIPAADFTVGVQNPGGCSAALDEVTVTVELGPVALFADPPTLYNGIDTRITVYALDFAAQDLPITASLLPVGEGDPIVLGDVDGSDLEEIYAVVPAATPAGTYSLELAGAAGGCSVAMLPSALQVVAQPDLELTAITPSQGWTDEPTPVTITCDATGGGFVSTPRVYLNPVGASSTAIAVQAVAFLDQTTLTAVIPAGLDVDAYDVIVVNPDGTVGVTDPDERFSVVAQPPPRIDSVSPGSVLTGATANVTVTGANFRSPVVEMLCENDQGQVATITVAESSSDASTFVGTFDPSALTPPAYCIVQVKNPDETFDLFSSLVITNLDQKMFPIEAGPDMTMARRGLAAAAGRVNNAARYVYAIGGDDGTETGVFDSVEVSAVDIVGQPYGFNLLQYRMNEPRSLHGAIRAGRFIYVVGGRGSDGGDPAAPVALDSVERAYILSPEETPEIDSVDLEVVEGSGLGAGTWYYRVSAVGGSDHPFNPGGESLPSELFVVRLPELGEYGVNVNIMWEQLADPYVTGYRVYRSPTGTEEAGAEQLIAEVGLQANYIDSGTAAGGQRALGIGALGKWHTPLDPSNAPLALTTPRMGAAVTMALNPEHDGFAIYALGGRANDTAEGEVQLPDTYEYALVSLEADGTQVVVQNFEQGTERLTAPRWLTGAWQANPTNASHVLLPDATPKYFIYLGGGASLNALGETVNFKEVEWSQIAWPTDLNGDWLTGYGQLGAFTSFGGNDQMAAQIGFGAILANNYLYAFGGKQGTGTDVTKNHQIQICNGSDDGSAQGCNGSFAPSLRNWTNTSSELTIPRRMLGVALESAFIYLLGGETNTQDGPQPTATTEMTIW